MTAVPYAKIYSAVAAVGGGGVLAAGAADATRAEHDTSGRSLWFDAEAERIFELPQADQREEFDGLQERYGRAVDSAESWRRSAITAAALGGIGLVGGVASLALPGTAARIARVAGVAGLAAGSAVGLLSTNDKYGDYMRAVEDIRA